MATLTPIAPMLASTADAPLESPDFAYEPKYDGIRAVAVVGPREVTLWSRLGNEKTKQFPEIVHALEGGARDRARGGGEGWARARGAGVVLDGELVALDEDGQPAGFQDLQGRIHVKTAPAAPAA